MVRLKLNYTFFEHFSPKANLFLFAISYVTIILVKEIY